MEITQVKTLRLLEKRVLPRRPQLLYRPIYLTLLLSWNWMREPNYHHLAWFSSFWIPEVNRIKQRGFLSQLVWGNLLCSNRQSEHFLNLSEMKMFPIWEDRWGQHLCVHGSTPSSYSVNWSTSKFLNYTKVS